MRSSDKALGLPDTSCSLPECGSQLKEGAGGHPQEQAHGRGRGARLCVGGCLGFAPSSGANLRTPRDTQVTEAVGHSRGDTRRATLEAASAPVEMEASDGQGAEGDKLLKKVKWG